MRERKNQKVRELIHICSEAAEEGIMKEHACKGFSLVELIIVIAIMAILAATIAPALIRYIEKSREATDQDACDEIWRVINNELVGDDQVFSMSTNVTFKVTVDKNGTTFSCPGSAAGSGNNYAGYDGGQAGFKRHVEDVMAGMGIKPDASNAYHSSDLKVKCKKVHESATPSASDPVAYSIVLTPDGVATKYIYFK